MRARLGGGAPGFGRGIVAAAAPARAPGTLAAGQAARRLASWPGLVAVGGALGAYAHAKLAAPEVVYRERIVTVEAKKETAPVQPVVVIPSVTPDALPPSRVVPVPSAVKHAPASSDLAAERRVLEIATAALGRGEGAASMAAIERHAREFPNGQLVEEREAVAVRALVLSGRMDEASTRARRFRSRFPNSPFLPSIDEALR